MHGEHDFFASAPLTVALAMAVGVTAQAVARHLNIPGIVLLLGVGVVMGPDVANIVRPETMDSGLQVLVGFAVAIILFEGGLNLRVGHLRSQAKIIQRLVTVGALVTAAGATLVCKLVMGWDWRLSALFGTLVIVTGPTVITPLLKRLRVRQNLSTILEAEGIFIDAVGATIAVVAFEVALRPSAESAGWALPDIALLIGTGAAVGAAGGVLLAVLLRWRYVIPRGLENIFTLAASVAIFQISNGILHESGITAAIVAGFVVGNARSHALGEIAEFKEQLTVLLIATLFVLLAADVRVSDVLGLGWRGVVTVLLLMVLVRPLTVMASTVGAPKLERNELVFLSWLAPRGIVAAAVASLFAIGLAKNNIEGGIEMRALVFLVIAMTVTVQGLTGGALARFLGVKRASDLGFLILGANPLARLLGRILVDNDKEVAFIDANPEACGRAQEEGFKVYYGNGLDEHMLKRARADARSVAVGLTGNEGVNLLFVRHINDEFYGPKAYVALETAQAGVTADMVDTHEARLLFGGEAQLARWTSVLNREQVRTEVWVVKGEGEEDTQAFKIVPTAAILPMVLIRRKQLQLVHSELRARVGDQVVVAINEERKDEAMEWLRARRMVPRDLPSTPRRSADGDPATANEKVPPPKAGTEPYAEAKAAAASAAEDDGGEETGKGNGDTAAEVAGSGDGAAVAEPASRDGKGKAAADDSDDEGSEPERSA